MRSLSFCLSRLPLAIGLAALVGCNEPSTPPAPKPPAENTLGASGAGARHDSDAAEADGDQAVTAEDVAALRDFVQQRSGGAPAADAALPAGHPPINAAPPQQPALPAGHPPIGGAASAGASGGDLQFDAPDDWQAQPPSNAMRKAQYVLPRATGDGEDGELIVFYFGAGEGGSVQANLQRWRAMFQAPDGQALPEDAGSHEEFDVGGLKVSVLDVTGRYAPSPMMPGAPARAPADNHRMIAAVVTTAQGPYFFKATGPAATMERHADAIRASLRTVRQ